MSVRHLEWLLLAAVAPLVWLSLLDFPRTVYDIDHDLSSSAAIEYFAAHGVQFGTELVQNVGPLGWAHQTSIYAGYLHTQKLLLGFLTRSALALLVLWACTRFEGRLARAGWLAAILAPLAIGAPSVDMLELFHEGFAYLAVYLAALALFALGAGRGALLLALAPVLLLSVLALEKHTLLAMASLAVGTAILEWLRRSLDRAAFALGALYLVLIALVWLLSAQRIENLPSYALGAWRFGSGYNEVMAWPAPPGMTRLGLAVLLGLASTIALRAATRSQGWPKTLLDSLLLFTIWKHGFVRADPPHVAIFFHAAIPLVLLFGLAREGPSRADAPRALAQRAAIGVLALGIAGLCAVALLRTFPGTSYRPSRAIELWSRNLEWLESAGWRTRELEAVLRNHELDYALPQIQRVVGPASIDFFGSEPGWLLLNHFHYVARPMPIVFGAANEPLRRRNEEFYRGTSGPAFVLAQLDPSGDRLVALDDGLALGALLDNYHPVTSGGDLLLLERNAPDATRAQAERRPLAERAIGLGEPLALEAFGAGWIWLEIDVRPSWLGRLRSLVLRPAPLRIELDVDGRAEPSSRRYFASMGSSGFLASPYIESSTDLAKAYLHAGALLPRVRSIRINCAPEDRRYFQPQIRARILEGLPPPAAGD